MEHPKILMLTDHLGNVSGYKHRLPCVFLQEANRMAHEDARKLEEIADQIDLEHFDIHNLKIFHYHLFMVPLEETIF
jgi:hypothetical protein